MNKTEEVANKIKNLLAKGENEINSEFMRGEILFGIALMKEADVHRQTLSKASADLIEKCEMISLKYELNDPNLADRATLLINKVNKLELFNFDVK